VQSGGAPEQPGNGDCPEAAQQQQAGQFGGGDVHQFHPLSSQKCHRGTDVGECGCQQRSLAEPAQAIGHGGGKLSPQHGHPEGR